MSDPVAAARHRFGSGGGSFTVFAPGRVNLIGDHIDYSGGMVLPMAIDRGTTAVVIPREDDLLRGYSENFPGSGILSASLGDTAPDPSHGWFSYVLAMVHTARESGIVLTHGFDILLSGTIPDGAGLSSSASVEMAVAVALERLCGAGRGPAEWALLAQRAENDYIGVACGIMDQFAIACGAEGRAMLLDCASLVSEPVTMPADVTVVVADTRQPRRLAGSEYNDRRAGVDRALAIIREVTGMAVPTLVAVTQEQLGDAADRLHAAGVFGLARHTVTEQARVLATADALRAGAARAAGRLMRESHESLRDDFAVTGAALDSLAEAAWATPGVLGARMTGAGFGGCTVNLVRTDMLSDSMAEIAQRYRAASGVQAVLFGVRACAGARVVAP